MNMQPAILLGASMMFTLASLGFVSQELGCTEACFTQVSLLQSFPEEDGRNPRAGNPLERDQMKRGQRGERGETSDRGSMGEMHPRMLGRMMDVAKEIDPELAEQLRCLCHDDPDALRSVMRRQGRNLSSLVKLKESDPELFEVKVSELKLDGEIYQITKSIRNLGPDGKVSEAQIASLRGLVRAKTALSIRAQTLSINRLERHIAAMREKIESTSENFDEVVEEHVERILQNASTPEQE